MLSFYNHKMIETGKRYGYKCASFDLQAGHTCPMANLCNSRVIEVNGRRKVEKRGEFMCYAVKAEVQYPNVHNLRVNNKVETLQPSFVDKIIDEIQRNKVTLLRIHSAGDFYDYSYFRKWLDVIVSLPDVLFFAYTKRATFMKKYLDNPLDNFRMTYSLGGLEDAYAMKYNLPFCQVIVNGHNPYGLPISCTPDNPADDFEYIMRGESFGINFH